MSKFDDVFRPWKKLINRKISDECPCENCEVNKDLIKYRYQVMMSGGLQEKITEPCEHCLKHTLWNIDVYTKLAWYENNDERFKKK